jgi:hypothetical protein
MWLGHVPLRPPVYGTRRRALEHVAGLEGSNVGHRGRQKDIQHPCWPHHLKERRLEG